MFSSATDDPQYNTHRLVLSNKADFVVAGKTGSRRVPAHDFFQGLFTTELRPAEVLTAIEIPIPSPEHRSTFLELTRRHGDYAIVGIAAIARNIRGTLSDVQLAYLGAGQVPVLAQTAMAAVEGKCLSPAIVDAAAQALTSDLDPSADSESTSTTKMHLARVLTGRALAALNA